MNYWDPRFLISSVYRQNSKEWIQLEDILLLSKTFTIQLLKSNKILKLNYTLATEDILLLSKTCTIQLLKSNKILKLNYTLAT